MEARLIVERSLRFTRALLLLAAVHGSSAVAVSARDEAPPAAQDEPQAVGWTNETELSLALTGGNSAARTFGFGDTLRRRGESSRLQIRASGITFVTPDGARVSWRLTRRAVRGTCRR